MRVSTLATFLILALLLSGCQLPYLMSGAVEQIRILNKRTPINKAISSGKLENSEIEKLKYSQKASLFAEEIGLKCESNFKTYVKLNRPYVSYLVIASEKEQLKLKKWSFPLVGSFPYIGYFSEKKAKSYQKQLIKKNYDTYLRGASAYSSLGWFNEPILSSMIRGSKESLAETIFHECFHGTFFLKDNVELNERLAVFIAHKSLLLFLQNKPDLIKKELESWQDQKLFSAFLKDILDYTKSSYKNKQATRTEIFNKIHDDYQNKLKPNLKVLDYSKVFDRDLNNAKLLAFKTYFHDFKQLEDLYNNKFEGDIIKMIKYFINLSNKSKNKIQDELKEVNISLK